MKRTKESENILRSFICEICHICCEDSTSSVNMCSKCRVDTGVIKLEKKIDQLERENGELKLNLSRLDHSQGYDCLKCEQLEKKMLELSADVKLWRKSSSFGMEKFKVARELHQGSQAKLKVAIEALEFYEDQDKYFRDHCIDLGDCTPIIVDDGDTARQALTKLKEN